MVVGLYQFYKWCLFILIGHQLYPEPMTFPDSYAVHGGSGPYQYQEAPFYNKPGDSILVRDLPMMEGTHVWLWNMHILRWSWCTVDQSLGQLSAIYGSEQDYDSLGCWCISQYMTYRNTCLAAQGGHDLPFDTRWNVFQCSVPPPFLPTWIPLA